MVQTKFTRIEFAHVQTNNLSELTITQSFACNHEMAPDNGSRVSYVLMKVWVDADACPVQIRELIMRAALKRSVDTVFVANSAVLLAPSPLLLHVQVAKGADIADDYIAEHATASDIVVTEDIPLAARLVPNGVTVISPRGQKFDAENIADRLSRRDLLQELRETGAITGGPSPFNDKLKRDFANAFDAAVTRLLRLK